VRSGPAALKRREARELGRLACLAPLFDFMARFLFMTPNVRLATDPSRTEERRQG
jgi:hypothetical protein